MSALEIAGIVTWVILGMIVLGAVVAGDEHKPEPKPERMPWWFERIGTHVSHDPYDGAPLYRQDIQSTITKMIFNTPGKAVHIDYDQLDREANLLVSEVKALRKEARNLERDRDFLIAARSRANDTGVEGE